MISIDFLNKVYKILDSQEYNLSFSPAKFKNYMLYCNGNFIGGLFDEELCFVYADSVSELLGQPEPAGPAGPYPADGLSQSGPDKSGQISVPQTAAKVSCFYRSQRENQSGNHAETVVHRAGEDVPQSDSGIRRATT